MKGRPFALSFPWPDLAWVVLVVSVKSGPISVRSVIWRKTKPERPKLASYLRLKNSKRTSKCQSILFYSTQKLKSWTELAHQGGTLRFFIHSVANHQKKLKGPFGEKNWKTVPQCWKKIKRGTFWYFSTSILSENSKKIEGGNFFRKKSHRAENTLRE